MVTKIYRVEDMHCANCAMRIEALEDRLPGVVRIEASYRKGQMKAEFDEAVISEAQIMAAVERLGYTVQAMAGR